MIKIAQSTKLALSCFYIIISTLFIILHIKFYIKKQNILNFPFSTFSVIYQLYLNKAEKIKVPPLACVLTVVVFSRPKPGACQNSVPAPSLAHIGP